MIAFFIGATGIALACSSIPKSTGQTKSASSDHNVGIYEYSAAIDAWALVESWHEPNVIAFSVGPDDYIYSEPGWSTSVLFVNANPSAPPPDIGGGSGGGPPGGGGGLIPKSSELNYQASLLSASKSCDDPVDLGNLTVVGTSGGLRNWLGGASTAWGIIGNYGGGGGSSVVPAPGRPIFTQPPSDKRAKCSDSQQARHDHAISAFGLFRAMQLRRLRPLPESGSLVSIRFSGGGSESYQVMASTSTYPVTPVPGSLVCN